MKRRDFSAHLMGTGLAVNLTAGLAASLATTAWPTAAQAQGATQAPALVEGKDYLRLATPLAVPAGKIEVIDFFWYGCPHCYYSSLRSTPGPKNWPPMWPFAACR